MPKIEGLEEALVDVSPEDRETRIYNLGFERGAHLERVRTERWEREANTYREMWEEECRKNAASSRLNNVAPLT